MNLMVVVIDYGMGNLRSVSKALETCGASVRVSGDPDDVARAEKLILPGVGAFPAAVQELKRRGLLHPIRQAVAGGKPYLGICLGLQLLFERSEEGPGAGLGIFPGVVKRFSFHSAFRIPHSALLKVPHMGWNVVHSPQSVVRSQQQSQCPLLKGIEEGSFFYFVHSYYAAPEDPTVVTLEADYGGPFAAMVCADNIHATQFHPEKSQSVGLQLLKNFVEL